jgi:hypothetical protein
MNIWIVARNYGPYEGWDEPEKVFDNYEAAFKFIEKQKLSGYYTYDLVQKTVQSECE